jgi:hypothetical protein
MLLVGCDVYILTFFYIDNVSHLCLSSRLCCKMHGKNLYIDRTLNHHRDNKINRPARDDTVIPASVIYLSQGQRHHHPAHAL